MLGTPKRRVRVWARSLLVGVSLFLVTLIVCIIVFAFFVSQGAKILSPVVLGQQTQSSDAQIGQIKDFCQQNHINCQSVEQTDNKTIQITLDNNARVFFSTEKDLSSQLASLQEVITQLTIKGKQFKKLDFRFDNVVVSF